MLFRSILAAAFTGVCACAEVDPAADDATAPPAPYAAAGSLAAGSGGSGGKPASTGPGGAGGSLAAGFGGSGGSSAGAGSGGSGGTGAGGSSAAGSGGSGGSAAGAGSGGAAGSSAGAGSGGAGGSSATGPKIRCVAGDYNMTCDVARLAQAWIMWSVQVSSEQSITYNCNVESEAPACAIGAACSVHTSDGRWLDGTCARP